MSITIPLPPLWVLTAIGGAVVGFVIGYVAAMVVVNHSIAEAFGWR